MKATLATLFTSLVVLVGCATTEGRSLSLEEVVASQGGQRGSNYLRALTDLNGDGVKDALVLLQGSANCLPEGCPLLVLRGSSQGGFTLVSRTTPIQGPVSVATTRTNGWSDLIAKAGGVGEVLLVFESYGYTANAALAVSPSAGQRAQASVVLE